MQDAPTFLPVNKHVRRASPEPDSIYRIRQKKIILRRSTKSKPTPRKRPPGNRRSPAAAADRIILRRSSSRRDRTLGKKNFRTAPNARSFPPSPAPSRAPIWRMPCNAPAACASRRGRDETRRETRRHLASRRRARARGGLAGATAVSPVSPRAPSDMDRSRCHAARAVRGADVGDVPEKCSRVRASTRVSGGVCPCGVHNLFPGSRQCLGRDNCFVLHQVNSGVFYGRQHVHVVRQKVD